jgi:hypothetical protein
MVAKAMPFGVSQKWIDQRDDEIKAAKAAKPTYEELERLVAQLRAQLAQRQPAKPATRKQSFGTISRGRQRAESTVMRKGFTYYSMAHVAQLSGLDVSSVSRQLRKLGIKTEVIGGIQYIPASQASNIKKKRTRR